jgi:cell wall-associated NlpC family hydrolase
MSADYQPGDHLVVSRHVYTHHGVYAGDGWVVHKDFGPVRLESLRTFGDGAKIRVCPPQDGDFPAATVLARAVSRLGEDRYDLLSDNCEHFVRWCRNGKADSPQITAGLRALGVALAARALLLHPAVAVMAGLAAYVLLDDRHGRKLRRGVASLGDAITRNLPRFART